MNQFELRDLITIHNGKDHKALNDGNIPVYGSGGIMRYVDDYLFDGEAILLPRKGTLNNIQYTNGKFWCVDTTYWATAKNKNVNLKYLFCYLSLLDLSARDSGSALPSMTFESYYSLMISLPDLKTQEKVAGFVFNLLAKIDNNNKIVSELESMAKTIYDYWFLQFEFPNEDGKPYKSSGGKMVWNEELKREIPEGWGVSQIEKLLGKYPKTTSVMRDDYKKGTIYPIIDQSQEYICGYTDDIDKVLHMKSAIVFGDHTNIAKYVNFDFARGADGTQIVNSNNEAVSNYMLYLQICELPVIEQGYSRHFKFLKEQKVVVPRLEISKKYDSKIDAILTERRKCIQENRELASLRDFLLPLLMNGQVTFKEKA